MKLIKFSFVCMLALVSAETFSHTGKLNKYGGHNCSQKAQSKGLCSGYHTHEDVRKDNYKKERETTRISKYNRKEYPHWTDMDGDCQDARAETLIRDSLVQVKFKRNKGCNVSHGKWLVPYTNKIITKASAIDVDHIVPLGHAHFNGAAPWNKGKKRAFANDPENLLSTSASANRSKSDKGPDEWMPPYKEYHCEYLRKWVYIKEKYDLSASSKELRFLQSYQKECKF